MEKYMVGKIGLGGLELDEGNESRSARKDYEREEDPASVD